MTQWRKSSHSGATQGTDCVELAALPEGVGLRDSKAPDAGHLTISPESFAALLEQIKNS
ncbi:protein of unknown function [Thermomonospora echinospora]|uniref:DUF397 domain-containing protein n=1 Tax=Thermomonospora echinospora TaxID=1992 RepID=A0A1H5YH56_9ACTN|nr:DUF397 domain-containing protein [Thermomonospora echinospora]SEG23368.1 protein of unknown function [Thermomonospora echinospora]